MPYIYARRQFELLPVPSSDVFSPSSLQHLVDAVVAQTNDAENIPQQRKLFEVKVTNMNFIAASL